MTVTADAAAEAAVRERTTWPGYRTVWRWHFYAGLFSIPFVLWLSITGSIYLFKPQIEGWLDRPYDHLHIGSHRHSAAEAVKAALGAVPGSFLHSYELPRTDTSAARVLTGKGADEFRVYVNPGDLRILSVVNEERRPMRLLFHLHGELLMGDRGSMLMELAASWAIVMIVTGISLWFPRSMRSLAGVVFPRLRAGRRIFWRDLHAVTGVWISVFALFLLFSGLPWSKSWGGLLKTFRQAGTTHRMRQDWTTGSGSEGVERMARTHAGMALSMDHAGEHSGHMRHGRMRPMQTSDLEVLNKCVPAITALHLAYPVLISPPMMRGGGWTARSDAQNRTLRADVMIDGKSGAVVARKNFEQRPWIDRVVGVGVAAHEGQLFGWLNQALGLFTTSGLILLSISAVRLWWMRRPSGLLGAPAPLMAHRPSPAFVLTAVCFALYLPLLGISALAVWLLERFVFRRIAPLQLWLGLPPARVQP